VRLRIDYDELWYHLLGGDVDDIDQALWETLEIDRVGAEDLLDKLMPLIDVAKSPLTGDTHKGFAKDGMWLAKMKCEQVEKGEG